MKFSRELKVGLIAIVAIAALYWGISFLQGSQLFKNERVYYAVYNKVDGLSPSRPVTINGYNVGKIRDIKFHPDNSGRLLVKFDMQKDFEIPSNSIARIYSDGLLGGKSIELVLGDSPQIAKSGDTLKSDIQLSLTEEVNEQVAPLKNRAEKLLSSFDSVLVLVQGFLDENAEENFDKSFNSIRRSFASIENTLNSLNRTMNKSEKNIVTSFDNIAKLTSTLRENRNELGQTLKNLNSVSDSLSKVRFKETFNSLNKALTSAEEVMQKINKGEGSAGKLVNDPQLYNNLDEATRQLNMLLMDIKYNPGRYINISVFGNNDREYTEEEMLEMEREAKKKRQKQKEKNEN